MGTIVLESCDERLALKRLKEFGVDISTTRQLTTDCQLETPLRFASSVLVGRCAIGAFTYFGHGCEIRRAKVGRFCSIAANVAIGPAEHPTDWVTSHPVAYDGVRYFDAHGAWGKFSANHSRFKGNSRDTVVGNDVWIGRNAIVRQGCDVGNGAVIAGGAFVNRDVPPYAIVAGVPARIIKYRFPEGVVQKLTEAAWWEWEIRPKENSLQLDNVERFLDDFMKLRSDGKLERFTPNKVWTDPQVLGKIFVEAPEEVA